MHVFKNVSYVWIYFFLGVRTVKRFFILLSDPKKYAVFDSSERIFFYNDVITSTFLNRFRYLFFEQIPAFTEFLLTV